MITFSKLGNYGRLGNQLFQIASTIGIAKYNDTEYTFPVWKYQKFFCNELPHFPIHVDSVYLEDSPYYQEVILSRLKHWDLQGYFQSWKYFANSRDEIKYYFYFDKVPVNRVAIHVRRGDYLTSQFIHPILPIEYYTTAMQEFPSHAEFTVFSDDIPWCKENFIGDRFQFSEGRSEIEDLFYMAEHRGFIIANSSFSWWAAYLSGSYCRVVAPINYVVGESKSDRLLPEWIKI